MSGTFSSPAATPRLHGDEGKPAMQTPVSAFEAGWALTQYPEPYLSISRLPGSPHPGIRLPEEMTSQVQLYMLVLDNAS